GAFLGPARPLLPLLALLGLRRRGFGFLCGRRQAFLDFGFFGRFALGGFSLGLLGGGFGRFFGRARLGRAGGRFGVRARASAFATATAGARATAGQHAGEGDS